MKHMDIIPPDPIESFTQHTLNHIDDLLLCLNWTLDTYTSLPKDQRARLTGVLEAYEAAAQDFKEEDELIKRIGKGWE